LNEPSLSLLPVHPEPVGIETPEVESLSGYLQRVATANHLPVASLLVATGWRRQHVWPRNPDLCPWDLTQVARLTRQPIIVLEQMSFVPLYHAFNSGQLAPPLAVLQFFRPFRRGAFVTRSRRYCPECLRDALTFRLRWQLREITVCLPHEVLLAENCPECGRSSPVLTPNSILGRCLHCGQLLTRVTPREAPGELLEQQRLLQRDYDRLLAGRIRFTVPVHPEAGAEGFLLRLEHIRAERGMTLSRFATICGVSPGVITGRRRQRSRLGSFLHLARRLTGSLEAFMRVPLAPTQVSTRQRSVDLPCLNPWCADYRSTRTTLLRHRRYVCRTCGCSFSRRRQTLYTLPVARFFQCLYEACARLPARGDTWLAPFAAAGLPLRLRNTVVQSLVHSGIVTKRGDRWVMTLPASRRIDGYPATPPLVLRARRRVFKLGDTPETFHRRIRTALQDLVRRGQPVTLTTLAACLNLNRNTFNARLGASAINVRKEIDAGRKAALARRRQVEERAAWQALPNIVAGCIGRGERPSSDSLCRTLRISLTRLKQRYPALAVGLLRARNRACRTLARRRRQRLKAQILQIVRALESHGDVPTYARVSARLGIRFGGDRDLASFFRQTREVPSEVQGTQERSLPKR